MLAEEPAHFQQASLLDSESRSDIADQLHPLVNDSDESPSDRAKLLDEFAELEAWKRERSERLERLMNIVREREAAAEAARLAAQSETAATETCEKSAAMIAEASPSSSPRTMPSPARPMTRRAAANAEGWEQTLDRWTRSLPHPRLALALLLVPLALWWLWPSSDAAIAETYRLMYFELLELRERPNDKTGMAEFVERSQAQLDQLIPGLERRASPNRPDVQWLLWMGRDCLRPMLKQPRQQDTKPERTFNKLLREWQRLHEPNVEPVEDSSVTSQASDSTSRSRERKPLSSTATARDPAMEDAPDLNK